MTATAVTQCAQTKIGAASTQVRVWFHRGRQLHQRMQTGRANRDHKVG